MNTHRTCWYRLSLSVAAVFLFAGSVHAGVVGKALGEMGFGEDVQAAGDALHNAATAAAIGGDEVRPMQPPLRGSQPGYNPPAAPRPVRSRGADAAKGISGALGELALNSGELTCSLWLIQLRSHLRNLTIEVTRAHDLGEDPAEIARLTNLMQKAHDLANKLEVACTRVGWLGIEPVEEWRTGTRLRNALGGGGQDEGAAPAEDQAPVPVAPPDPIPEGWNAADLHCRNFCSAIYEAYANALANSRNKRAQAEALRRGELADARNKEARAQSNLDESNRNSRSLPRNIRRDERLLEEARAKTREVQARVGLLDAEAAALEQRSQDLLEKLKECVKNCRQETSAWGLDASRIDTYFTQLIREGGSAQDAQRFSTLSDGEENKESSSADKSQTRNKVSKAVRDALIGIAIGKALRKVKKKDRNDGQERYEDPPDE